tara:strand:+ start:53 stop:1900 length:1848 start_codon:yes stop_codon:yes gene_type:complete
MTVIRPNSVSGITSITAQANEINFFRSNGALAGLQLNGVNFNTTTGVSTFNNLDVGGVLTYQDVTNVDSLGIGTFRTGINVSGGQLDVGSNIKLGNAGVITATSFVGSGANLTSLPSQVSISNNADNRVITGGSGVNLNGEATLTYNGTSLLLGAGAVATPKVTQAGSLDLDSGGISLCIGGNENSNGRTNSTNKLNRIVTPHYTNAEEPMAMISGYSSSGASELFYGGGSGLTNAATSHHFYTATDATTTSGTKRLLIRANGQIIVGEANVNPANDFEVRRANAGGDVSIRIGNNTSQDSGSTASLYFTTSPTQTFNTFYIQAARADGSTRFGYGSSENMRLSNDGNLSIRTTGTPNFDRGADYGLYIAGSTYQKAGMAIRVDANDDNPASIVLAKSRSSGDTIVGRYDDVGQLDFMANDGNGFHTISRVAGSMDGENSVPGNNDMPGNLRFFTCEDSGTGLTERARIHSWGGLELSNCKIDYGSCDASHSYFYTFHKSGTYNNFYVDIGFMNPGGYNLEMMLGGFNNRRMHSTAQGYVYNGSHFGSIGAIDSGNGPQRNWSVINNYGSYGSLMRFAFTSMSITHAVVTMRLSFGPAGGSGRASRAEIYDVQWS